MITKNIRLYLGDGFPVRIPVSQFDTMWQFVFTIVNNSQPWQIPTGATAVLNGKKPDGNVFAFAGTIADNKVTVDADVQMTAVAGQTVCELSILSDGKVVGTANFVLDVEAAPKSPNDVSSESTLPAYGDMIEQAAELVGAAQDIIDQGPFLPSGGTNGQVLTKAANGVEWSDVSAASGAPIPVTLAADMTDTDSIYLYMGGEAGYTTGHWYFYANGQWNEGGAYGSTFATSMSAAAQALLINILRKGIYMEDVSAYISQLDDELDDSAIRYDVKKSLSDGVTDTNSQQYARERSSYTNNLVIDEDYVVTSVVVTMGGVDITATAYDDTTHTISIDSVTGAINISVSAYTTAVYYTVTNTLTDVTNSNDAEKAKLGNAYTATLTWETGYELTEISVTMGGVDITATAYGDGYILITEVTGDIVIRAVAILPPELQMNEIGGTSGTNYYSTSDKTTQLVSKAYGKVLAAKLIPATNTQVKVTISNETESSISVGKLYCGGIRQAFINSQWLEVTDAVAAINAGTLSAGASATFTYTVPAGSLFAVQKVTNLTYKVTGIIVEETMPESDYTFTIVKDSGTVKLYEDDGTTQFKSINYPTILKIHEQLATDKTIRFTVRSLTNGGTTLSNCYAGNATTDSASNSNYASALSFGTNAKLWGHGKASFTVNFKSGYYPRIYNGLMAAVSAGEVELSINEVT